MGLKPGGPLRGVVGRAAYLLYCHPPPGQASEDDGQSCVHTVFSQAGIQGVDAITVRLGVTEEDFERAFFGGHKIPENG